MPLATPNRDGGSTDERGILRSVGRILEGNVQSGFRVRQNSPLGMSVLVGGESGTPDDLLIRNTAYHYSHPVFIDDNQPLTVTVPTANPSNPRKDLVVVYVDYSEAPDDTFSNNTNGVIKVALIQGTAQAVPLRPTNADVLSVIGASNYYVEVGEITVPAGASTVTNSMITDTRSMSSPAIRKGFVKPEHRSGGSHAGIFSIASTGTVNVSGLGFRPKAIIFIVLFTDTNESHYTSTGFWSENNGINIGTSGARGASGQFRRSRTNRSIIVTGTTGTALSAEAYVSAVDEDGFTVTVLSTVNSPVAYLAMG